MHDEKKLIAHFLNSSEEIFCIINRDGFFIYQNIAAPSILGSLKEELQSKKIFEFLHEDDVLRTKDAIKKALKGVPQSFENRFRGKSAKEYKWISWNMFSGEKDVYAIARDVTSIHVNQETLQTAQNRLRLLHQATSNPTQNLGEKIERVLSLGNKQLGMSLAIVSRIQDDICTVVRSQAEGIAVKKGDQFNLYQTFDSIPYHVGNLIGIQNIKHSVYDEHPAHRATKFESYLAVPLYMKGKIFGVLSFSNDTARSKKFEVTDYDFVRLMGQWVSSSLALVFANEQIAYNAAVVSSSEDAIIGQTPDGHISLWNTGAEKLFGYTEGEMIGKHFSIIIPNDAKEELETIIDKLLKGERVEHYDTRRLRKDGELIDVSLTISPIINEEGEIIGASSVARDITQKKQIDKAKTEFVSLASHQLRTPLSAISWYAELLRGGEAGKMTKQQRDFVDEIFKGNQRMVRLVNELLNVSRIDFGNFTIEPVNIDVLTIAKSVIKELTPTIKKKRLNVVEEYKKERLMYLADPNIFRIVIQNLFSNAVKYTPHKGKIIVKIEEDEKLKKLVVKVSDTGFGIPKNQHKQLYTKLFRADNVREMDTAGTGLGLYILKAVVEESGGSVSFESVEGEGSIFTVLLPLSGMKRKEGGKGLSQITP